VCQLVNQDDAYCLAIHRLHRLLACGRIRQIAVYRVSVVRSVPQHTHLQVMPQHCSNPGTAWQRQQFSGLWYWVWSCMCCRHLNPIRQSQATQVSGKVQHVASCGHAVQQQKG
jgi:hypothetical protein